MAALPEPHPPPTDPTVTDPLPGLLRALRAVLAPLVEPGEEGEAAAAARAVIERLDRDLLPRTAGGRSHLVVGVVGPNNAGKSALFNALLRARISPSLATGGATRRLVGAAHPALLARLEGEPSLARFPLRRATPGPDGVAEALVSPRDPAELVLVAADTLDDGVLLVDAPDFDSIADGNRRAAEALLRVTDLALVVVTRHTYQNRDVVAFLEEWLAHGRPWLLVYNEALDDAITAAHGAKLVADVGAAPVATFAAPFALEVADGRAPLAPRALPGAPATAQVPPGTPLAEWLFDLARAAELKTDALAASLGQLRDELHLARTAASGERDGAAELDQLARARARRLGAEVAGAAMPMGPFLEAFRAVLDRRPNLLRKGLRAALRKGRAALEGALRRLRGRAAEPARAADAKLVELERAALEPAWPPFFEALAAELPARVDAAHDPGLARDLAADLDPGVLAPAGRRAQAALACDPQVLRAFQAACEELIEAELAARGSEWLLQLAVDALHLLPAVAAGVVIVQTGGLGADVAVGGAGALTSLLAERVSRLLGTSVAWRARQRWTELRGARVAEVALAEALPTSGPRLVQRRASRDELSTALDRVLEGLA